MNERPASTRQHRSKAWSTLRVITPTAVASKWARRQGAAEFRDAADLDVLRATFGVLNAAMENG